MEELEKIKKELENLDKKELIERLSKLQFLFNNLDPSVKYWINNLFKLCRAVRRDYNPIVGVLVGVSFEVKEVDIWVEEDFKEYSKGLKVHERKIVKVKPTSLVQFDIIEHREEEPEKKVIEGI